VVISGWARFERCRFYKLNFHIRNTRHLNPDKDPFGMVGTG